MSLVARLRFNASLICLLLVLGATATSGGVAGSEGGEEGGDVEQLQLHLQPVVDDVVAHAVADVAYSSVAVDVVRNEIHVYRVAGLNETFGHTYEEVAGDRAKVVLSNALLTEDQNKHLLDKVNSSVADLRAQGIVLSYWGAFPQRRAVPDRNGECRDRRADPGGAI